MNGHFLGREPSTSPAEGTSISVRRWLDVAGGEAVHAPSNPFRVERVTEEESYCLGCFGVRNHDVIDGFQVSGSRFHVSVCRVCGEEVRDG